MSKRGVFALIVGIVWAVATVVSLPWLFPSPSWATPLVVVAGVLVGWAVQVGAVEVAVHTSNPTSWVGKTPVQLLSEKRRRVAVRIVISLLVVLTVAALALVLVVPAARSSATLVRAVVALLLLPATPCAFIVVWSWDKAKSWFSPSLGLLSVTIFLILVRHALVGSGTVYTTTLRRGLDVAVWLVPVILLAVLIGRLIKTPTGGASAKDRREVVTVVATVVAAVAALLAGFLPQSAADAARPACRNAQVDNVRNLATTRELGPVQAHSGPGTGYAVTQTFDDSCTIGFNTFCIGEFVASKDVDAGLPDSRWLRLPERRGFVSAHDVVAQSDFGKDLEQCDGGSTPPVAPQAVPRQDGAGWRFDFLQPPSDLTPAVTGAALVRRSAAQPNWAILSLGVANTYAVTDVERPGGGDSFPRVDANLLNTTDPAYVVLVACYAVGAARDPDERGSLSVTSVVSDSDAVAVTEKTSLPKLTAENGSKDAEKQARQRLARTACLPRPGG